ncbi:MAG: DUF3387 domain-containing protein, partial [Chloroflexia bacterium]|nr:DUF3387 domain-containing protein [Chloroflexia bacterium]
FEEVTEAEEAAQRERLKSRWTQLEEVVGTPKRLAAVAADLVAHFEKRQETMAGKAMVVCMSRRICADLYDAIARLRPEWVTDDDATGAMKVVMTGSASDPAEWQQHIRAKSGRRAIEDRFKDPADELRIVLVRDMWLTGFDVPPLHTMYLDKPMRGHALMQAIARVNRVFRDKPGGLVVDYLGLANNLREALRVYSESGGRGRGVTGVDDEHKPPDERELIAAMLEKLEVCRGLFHGFDYGAFLTGSASERLAVIPNAQDWVLWKDIREEPGFRKRFEDQATLLLQAFALAGATDQATKVKAEVAFFNAVKAALAKLPGAAPNGRPGDRGDLDHAVRQLIDDAIAPGGVVDIFAAAGLQKPNISILSEGFLAEVRELPQKNLAVELLRKLLNDEIGSRGKGNVAQSRLFSERLKDALGRYRNRSIETAQVIEELIALANDMRDAEGRGEKLGLSDDEVAFYDTLGGADMAAVMGDEALRTIAREVAKTVRANTKIDWSVRESVRADMRRSVRRVLRRVGYPPERTEDATELVVKQAELLTAEAAA